MKGAFSACSTCHLLPRTDSDWQSGPALFISNYVLTRHQVKRQLALPGRWNTQSLQQSESTNLANCDHAEVCLQYLHQCQQEVQCVVIEIRALTSTTVSKETYLGRRFYWCSSKEHITAFGQHLLILRYFANFFEDSIQESLDCIMGCNTSKGTQVTDPSKKPKDRPKSANSSDKEEEDNVKEISHTENNEVETEDSW